MAETKVVFYKERDKAPVLEWIKELPRKVQDKCRVKIERLAELGHELRRPEADFLRDGIYELRVRHQRVNYRILYFFHGNVAAVLANGIVKEDKVPPKEIDRALERKKLFESNPDDYTFRRA